MKVCFIGHRTVADTEQIEAKLRDIIPNLIANGVDTFLFGSKSDFNSLCYEVVTDIQAQFPNVKRISYNAPHEAAITEKEERKKFEQIFSELLKREIRFADYEETVNSQKAKKANKNVYIMRNREMIDDSDICVFYYDKDYLPPKRKSPEKLLPDRQPKSGTAIAFEYAVAKKKKILNLFD